MFNTILKDLFNGILLDVMNENIFISNFMFTEMLQKQFVLLNYMLNFKFLVLKLQTCDRMDVQIDNEIRPYKGSKINRNEK